MTTNKTKGTVTVIGLGMMGTTLAQLLLKQGYDVTVWNRSADKAAGVVASGAKLADSAAAAVAASAIIIICVHNYTVTQQILAGDATAAALKGKVLVQLSSGTSAEARAAEQWAGSHGAVYLDGAIQAAPEQMGRPDTPIFISGSSAAYQSNEEVLRVFGGGLTYLGDNAGAASAMDLATLSYIYGASLGFFHGALIAETEGFDLSVYGDLVAGITPTFGDFLKHEAEVIKSNDFTISQSPMSISIEATDRILQQATGAGISSAFPKFAAGLFRQGSAAGLAQQEVAALIKVLRKGDE